MYVEACCEETKALTRRREERTINNTSEPGEGLPGSHEYIGADGDEEEPWVARLP